ncbi:MAG TPA: hypothetical protein VF390_00295 [Patescibacteria group bacterium]
MLDKITFLAYADLTLFFGTTILTGKEIPMLRKRTRPTTAEKIREAALGILRITIQLPISELQQRVESKIGKELRFEYFLGNFSGDRRFDFCNDPDVGLSVRPAKLPERVTVIAAWKREAMTRLSA